MEYQYHNAADIFPLEENTLQELGKDIKKNGLLCPIELFKGKILDGRRRYQACLLVGVEPEFCDIVVPDPINYVFSLNYHRRNLSVSQRAMVVGRAEKLRSVEKKAAKERQGTRTDIRDARRTSLTNNSERSSAAIGKKFGISGRSAERGIRVVDKGTEEVKKAVDQGKTTVNAMQKVVALPKEKQNEALAEELKKQKNKSKNKKEKKSSQGSNSSSIPDSGKENWAVPVVDKVWQVASLSADETISNLTRSPLFKLPKNNPHKVKAFKMVISWLKERMKEIEQ